MSLIVWGKIYAKQYFFKQCVTPMFCNSLPGCKLRMLLYVVYQHDSMKVKCHTHFQPDFSNRSAPVGQFRVEGIIIRTL